jgi:hypothetical protein
VRYDRQGMWMRIILRDALVPKMFETRRERDPHSSVRKYDRRGETGILAG